VYCKERIDPFYAYRFRPMEWNDVDGLPARSESYNASGLFRLTVDCHTETHVHTDPKG
jgi:hypothetical protein